jgi:hypothetical protein
MEIKEEEVFGIDWDWYAVDTEGNIGHFATAGIRPLPASVRCSKEGLDLVHDFFLKRAEVRGRAFLTEGLEKAFGAFNRPVDWACFLDMAARGLYSFDTELIHTSDASYYVVAKPEHGVVLAELPNDVRGVLERTTIPVSFPVSARIPEALAL